MLLLQPVVGVEAKGKPETATFRIWIGVGGEDVVLTSTGYFDVVTSVDGWYPDEKGRLHVWRIPIYEDRYGYYDMNRIYSEWYENYLTDFYTTGDLAQLGWLEHHWDSRADEGWTININWNAGDLNGDGVDETYFLDGWAELWGGTFDPTTDTWTVPFRHAFSIYWREYIPREIGHSGKFRWTYYYHFVWEGYLDFTVTIQKIT